MKETTKLFRNFKPSQNTTNHSTKIKHRWKCNACGHVVVVCNGCRQDRHRAPHSPSCRPASCVLASVITSSRRTSTPHTPHHTTPSAHLKNTVNKQKKADNHGKGPVSGILHFHYIISNNNYQCILILNIRLDIKWWYNIATKQLIKRYNSNGTQHVS